MSDYLKKINIVLVDTQDAANIGSVCRAMKTMGINNLIMVTSNKYDENRIKTLALHAFDIWENRKTFNNLEDALKHSALAIATSRRHGKFRKTRFYTPKEMTEMLKQNSNGSCSIVFGCESSGLTDKQLNLCQCLVSIPTSENFPSLNLSQAVQIICYELYQTMKNYPDYDKSVDINRASNAAANCTKYLSEFNYFKLDLEKDFTFRFIRDLIGRAGLTEGEVKRLEKIFFKTSKIIQHKYNNIPD